MKNTIETYVEYATIYYENLLLGNSKISVNDKIRMYKKSNLKMYKIVHR